MFKDRENAGSQLAKLLEKYYGQPNTVVLAIPRGGVATGSVVAQKLNLPFGVLVVRKLGYPGNPEFAIGAVDVDGEYILSEEFVQSGIEQTPKFRKVLQQELAEVKRRMQLFNPAPLEISGKTTIVVDDGIATGQTNLVAVRYLQRHQVTKVIVAAPVASQEAVQLLKNAGAEVVVIDTPINFMAVGQFYEYFPQLTDEEVLDIIDDVFPASSSWPRPGSHIV